MLSLNHLDNLVAHIDPRVCEAWIGLKELGNGFRIDGRRLVIHGVGRLHLRWHRPVQGTIKTVRVVERAGKRYVLSPLGGIAQEAAPL